MCLGDVKLRRHHRTDADADKVYPTSTRDIIQRFTADAEQREPALNQTLPGVYMSFSPVFNTPPTLPVKPRGPSVSAFTAASPGRRVGGGAGQGQGEGHYETR